MKTFIVAFLTTFLLTNSEVDKRTLSYSIIIPKSELIVEGIILNLSDNQYEFSVSEFIKGSADHIITIKKWKEWECDTRLVAYETGQKLILFLIKSKSGEYEIINGSTGELIINEDGSIERYEYQSLPKITIVKEGIKMIISAIDYDGPLYTYSKDAYKFLRLIDQSKYDRFRSMNEFFYKATRGVTFEE